MAVRSLLTLVAILMAAPLTGCMAWLGPAEAPPREAGPHPVGVVHVDVEDTHRGRELPVEVWYPAANRTSGPEAVYQLRTAGITTARLRSRLHAHRNVPAWRSEGPRPVVLLSHGAGSNRFGNVSLAEVLASHGYIVAAPDHPGHTTSDRVFGISDEARAQSAYDRPLDLTAVLDALERRSHHHGSVLEGTIDMDRVAVAGHSFGGRAALGMVGARFDGARQARECADNAEDRRCLTVPIFGAKSYRYRDPRVKAALLLTPAGFDFYREDGIAEVDAPVLVVGADRDATTPYAEFSRATYRALRSESYLLPLEDAGHLTATDICAVVDSVGFFAKALGGDQAQDGCGESYLSNEEALDEVAAAALPFLDLYLEGHTAAQAELLAALTPAGRHST
ncbi:MAG: alpha/beta hydrolase [Myxococcales bacterium]|nr:alpha/beta hydrolase [Myxococcales bacterium]